jgi:uncharacterized protein YbjT (DUF2867 family)
MCHAEFAGDTGKGKNKEHCLARRRRGAGKGKSMSHAKPQRTRRTALSHEVQSGEEEYAAKGIMEFFGRRPWDVCPARSAGQMSVPAL